MRQGADYNELERKQAKRDGAELVKNSGRGQRKGDARLASFLLDYKYTSKGSFACNIKDFKKHEKDAWDEGYEPVIIAVFSEAKDKSIAMIDWEILKDLISDQQSLLKILSGEDIG